MAIFNSYVNLPEGKSHEQFSINQGSEGSDPCLHGHGKQTSTALQQRQGRIRGEQCDLADEKNGGSNGATNIH